MIRGTYFQGKGVKLGEVGRGDQYQPGQRGSEAID